MASASALLLSSLRGPSATSSMRTADGLPALLTPSSTGALPASTAPLGGGVPAPADGPQDALDNLQPRASAFSSPCPVSAFHPACPCSASLRIEVADHWWGRVACAGARDHAPIQHGTTHGNRKRKRVAPRRGSTRGQLRRRLARPARGPPRRTPTSTSRTRRLAASARAPGVNVTSTVNTSEPASPNSPGSRGSSPRTELRILPRRDPPRTPIPIEVERRAVCAAFGLKDTDRVKKDARVYWPGQARRMGVPTKLSWPNCPGHGKHRLRHTHE